MQGSLAAQDHVVGVDIGSQRDDVKSSRRTRLPSIEGTKTGWGKGGFFQVFWELKVLAWGVIAIAIAYESTYWLYARSIL
ncbi:MAG: hypothetical protein O7B26_02560 [Planctomycetota bacterium]|nr:hypothetical protein [Planctomycetota bacterium]